MLLVARAISSPGTLLEIRRQAQALADFLADPRHLAELVAANPGVEIGLASAEPVQYVYIRAGMENGRLFLTCCELEHEL